MSDTTRSSGGAIPQPLLHALGHPIRVRVLEALVHESASAKQLAKQFGIPLSNVAYHLCRVLDRECGIVSVVRTQQRRGATETFYEIDSEAIRRHLDWDSLPGAFRETLRGSSLAGFIPLAVNAIRGGSLDDESAVMCWQPVALDSTAWDEVREAVAQAVKSAEGAVAGSSERLKSSGRDAPRVHGVIGLAAFPLRQPIEDDV